MRWETNAADYQIHSYPRLGKDDFVEKPSPEMFKLHSKQISTVV